MAVAVDGEWQGQMEQVRVGVSRFTLARNAQIRDNECAAPPELRHDSAPNKQPIHIKLDLRLNHYQRSCSLHEDRQDVAEGERLRSSWDLPCEEVTEAVAEVGKQPLFPQGESYRRETREGVVGGRLGLR